MAGEQPHQGSEHPANYVQGVLIVDLEASAQLDSMPLEIKKAVLAAFQDLRVDPYGTVNRQQRSLRVVYHVPEHPSGLRGLMVLEDELYRMWYQVLNDVRGICVKVLEFPWWEGQPSQMAVLPRPPSQPAVLPRPPTPQRRNEGDYDFRFIANAIKRVGRIPGTIGATRFIRLGRRKSAPRR